MLPKFTKNNSIELGQKSISRLALIGEALSSEARLKIILAMENGQKTITKISKATGIPTSNVLFHLKKLEDAGIIYTHNLNGPIYASMQMEQLLISLRNGEMEEYIETDDEEYEIKIWNYVKVMNPTGSFVVFGKDKTLTEVNTENPFDESRIDAGMISTRFGNLSYLLKKPKAQRELREIMISLEICSEAPAYANEYPSDITFTIGKTDLVTWTCPGDFGGRKGLLTPDWYPSIYTQFGLLKTIVINRHGTFLDGSLIENSPTINDLDLKTQEGRTLIIGNKEDAVRKGGLNIFGSCFGDYPQDIKVRYTYIKN